MHSRLMGRSRAGMVAAAAVVVFAAGMLTASGVGANTLTRGFGSAANTLHQDDATEAGWNQSYGYLSNLQTGSVRLWAGWCLLQSGPGQWSTGSSGYCNAIRSKLHRYTNKTGPDGARRLIVDFLGAVNTPLGYRTAPMRVG